MTSVDRRRVSVAVAPSCPAWVQAAIDRGGGERVPLGRAEALVWMEPDDAAGLADVLESNPGVRWVQLPWAGVDAYAAAGTFADQRIFTSAKGVYSRPVAEHALVLALAGLRDIKRHSLATGWQAQSGTSLFDAHVVIFGSGGIAAEIYRLLRPFDCPVSVVARDGHSVDWAAHVVPWQERHDALAAATLVILALPLTPQTVGVMSKMEFDLMRRDAWLVNIARGQHVVTDDLLSALREERIAGASLDVTDPEPLPSEHELWTLPNCLITPHTAVPAPMAQPLLAALVEDNVRRFAADNALRGVVDARRGY